MKPLLFVISLDTKVSVLSIGLLPVIKLYLATGTSVAHINAYFGQSNETTLLSGVACTGVEPSLFTCLHNVGSNICPNCSSGKFYLHPVITHGAYQFACCTPATLE